MTFKELLKASNQEVLKDLLQRCVAIKPGVDIEYIENLSHLSARAVGDNSELPPQLNTILNRWYDSISINNENPDYSVYGEDEYIAELWACWKVYSKTHLLNICKSQSLFNRSIADDHSNSEHIVDLGCGFGYTTSAIKQIFPTSKVYGTNLSNTLQMSVAKSMAIDYDFYMGDDPSQLKLNQTDLVFASEYFEHFVSPIDHLDYIVETLNPKAMLIANAFGPRAIGHFTHYDVSDYQQINAKNMSKIFNNRMRYHGYKKIKTKLWNNRPNYWIKF